MENLALIDSFSEFKDDKSIDRVTLMAILEDVFRNALKKKFGDDDNFDIIINPDKGDLEIWRNRIVVADGEVEEPNQEISLTEAQKIEPDFEVGEDVSEEVKLIDLGRRSILALRQNLISKIHEHDNTNIYKQFKDLIGEIYTAEVHHIRHRAVILLDDEGNEIILPKEKQIPSDFFRKGDNVKGVLESVELKGNKPAIITTVNAMATPPSGLLAIMLVRTAVMITVIGPVGSEIRLVEPPKIAANKPTKMAPQSPASAPAPDATPKANAKGNETIAVVAPPNKSPIRVQSLKRVKSMIMICFLSVILLRAIILSYS